MAQSQKLDLGLMSELKKRTETQTHVQNLESGGLSASNGVRPTIPQPGTKVFIRSNTGEDLTSLRRKSRWVGNLQRQISQRRKPQLLVSSQTGQLFINIQTCSHY